ncbi:hypothetical protein EGW08_009765, partial [Elysia chlorotica]
HGARRSPQNGAHVLNCDSENTAPFTDLYVIRNSQATPSAPPPDTLPSLIHVEAPPLGTSTPIHQSPAVQRRLAPPLPSSCHNDQPIQLSGSTGCYATNHIPASNSVDSQRPSCITTDLRVQGRPRYESPRTSAVYHVPQRGHSTGAVAPLARLESEYF